MVKCVNTLRHAGKREALAGLTEFTQKHQDAPQMDDKLHWVCRLLFVNPKGWKQLGGIGSHDPNGFDEDVARRFPLFPIAMSDGVPFIISDGGYIFAGVPGPDFFGWHDVALCHDFTMITADLPTRNFQKAANKLVQSELFQKLYPESNKQANMTYEILNQED